VPNSSEDERNPLDEGKVPELNSPDSVNDDDVLNSLNNFKSPRRLQTAERCKTSPSPYYYSDLLQKKRQEEELQQERNELFAKNSKTVANSVKDKELAFKNKKSSSLDTPAAEKSVTPPKRYSITEEGVRIIRCDSPSSTTSDDSDCSECQKRREWHSHALAVVRAATQSLREQSSNDVEPEVYYQNSIVSQMPQNRFLDHPVICACATPNFVDDDQLFQPRSIFYVHQQGYQGCADCSITDDDRLKALIFDEMSVRQRKIYETAFDSRIAKSDDDLDEVERISSHTASLFGNEYRMVTSQSKDSFIAHPKEKRYRSKHSKKAQQKQNVEQEVAIIKDIENIKIEESIDNIVNANVSTAFTPSPPSTAPLPLKFPTKHEKFFINSIKSAPNLPGSNALQHPRLKDLRGSEKSDTSKERPRSVIEAGRVFELKRSHSGRNYSSTESMATSSSGGSMESIRSSTSDGNQSTTSSESRHSSSLSSHSSDSGPSIARPLRVPTLIHPKLQILSPISDKSAQEPVLENCEKNQTSADENGEKAIDEKQKKRPTSKTLLLIARDEIQGSDSGISLHSRDEKGKLSALCDNKIDNATGLPQDLPFDMPKLRRRRILLNQVSCWNVSNRAETLVRLDSNQPATNTSRREFKLFLIHFLLRTPVHPDRRRLWISVTSKTFHSTCLNFADECELAA
jgi:SH2 domain-containing adapter protein B/D/E/F